MKSKYLTLSLHLMLGVAIALSGCGPQTAETLTAALSELEGTVTMKQPGDEGFTQATADKVLVQDGQVQTGEDGRVRLDLSSGTIIRMAPSSLFTLVSNEEVEGGLATQLQLEAGEIFVILNGGSMDVETPSGVASVRGSYMHVWVDPDTLDVYVTCLEGSCHAGNEGGEVDFTDGEKTILFRRNDDGTYTPPEVEDMTPEDFTKWLENNPEAKELFDQAMATVTALAPTATQEPESSSSSSSASASSATGGGGGGGASCVEIVGPENGAELPHNGQITFEWSARDGATKYVVTFYTQNGNEIPFETDDTNLTRYIETLPDPGTYTWDVRAVGGDGGELCKTEPQTFEKPSSHQEDLDQKTPVPDDDPPQCDPCDEGSPCYYEGACNSSYYSGGQGALLPAHFNVVGYAFGYPGPALVAYQYN